MLMAFLWLEYVYVVILSHCQTFDNPTIVESKTLPTSIPEEPWFMLGE